jgi:hypothetical protein
MAPSERRSHKPANPFHFEDSVPLGRIFLSLNNPRFEEVETESEAIERLCTKEDVLPLARDIVRHGVSPLERLALTPIGKARGGQTYWVAEGNRRVCALKLLADPDRAPPKLRKSFEKLSESWVPIKSLPAAVFDDVETLRLWLDRVHSGPQGGIGRNSWDAEQKQRFTGGTKNRLAQAVLDYAESQGMISKEDRKGKLTTAQRFLNPEVFREALGIDASNPEELVRTRPKAQFDTMLRRFMGDLVKGDEVNSRKNKADIVRYARTITALPDVTSERVEPEPLTPGEVSKPKRTRRKPRPPGKVRHVQYDEEVNAALRGLGNEKLASLYYSICAIELEGNTPLLSIGAWAFLESLTACAGRPEGVAFPSFLSKQKLTTLGIPSGDQKAVRGALDRTSEYGNQTKHHRISATFNGDQLNNDMITLKPVIMACIEQAKQ